MIINNIDYNTDFSAKKKNIYFFKEFPNIFPRQHWVTIGCTENSQPKGLTVHSHCVESFKRSLAAMCRRGMACIGL